MPITVGTDTYISVADATTYLSMSINGAAWTAASTQLKEQALVTATRMLDRQRWVGTKTDSAQALDWPRTGVYNEEGDLLDPDVVPQFILDATCELALALILKPSLMNEYDANTNIKRLKAGSAEIEFFKGEWNGRFPAVIQELVGFYLTGYSKVFGSIASGTCATSELSDFNLTDSYK